jgi:hypothetical protein
VVLLLLEGFIPTGNRKIFQQDNGMIHGNLIWEMSSTFSVRVGCSQKTDGYSVVAISFLLFIQGGWNGYRMFLVIVKTQILIYGIGQVGFCSNWL